MKNFCKSFKKNNGQELLILTDICQESFGYNELAFSFLSNDFHLSSTLYEYYIIKSNYCKKKYIIKPKFYLALEAGYNTYKWIMNLR